MCGYEARLRPPRIPDVEILACFTVSGLATALALNWRNVRWGYWINLAVVSVADIGFIIFILLPGYLPPWPGSLGPIIC